MWDSIVDYLKKNGLGLLGGAAASIGTGNPAPIIAAIASTIGVEPTEDAVAKKLSESSPETFLKLKEFEYKLASNKMELDKFYAGLDMEGVKQVNATYQVELKSEDAYVRRMRPTMGYVIITTWFLMWCMVAYTIIFNPDKSVEVLGALSKTAEMWVVALSVIGVYVYKRSQDKEVAAGFQPAGLLGRFKGK